MAAFPHLLGLLVGGLLMFTVGLIDDKRGVGFSYKIKFAVQGLAAIVLVLSGIRIDFLHNDLLNGLVTIVWVVGITNAFNLLDNMDGLSSGVALISALILSILTIQQGQYFSALVLLTLAGSILGFLRYNFHPSTIFMGDAGSLFIGFTLATLTVTNSYVTTRSISELPVVVPVLVLGVPLFDTFSVMFIRWREHRPLFVGDKCHFSHRLKDIGLSTTQTVVFIYAVTLCVGMSAILIPDLSLFGCILVLIQEGLIFGLITLLIIKGKELQQLYHTVRQELEKIRAVSGPNGKVVVHK
jgi:UDP-GlcNAc:undecaprenyl-phosphate/decaprenyl-phosphate GlcNAc-1-phosphate transferase